MIHLARHGQTAFNAEGRFQGHLPVPLDDTGREQARALAEAVAQVEVRGFVCSPLARARETAAIVIARALPGLEARVMNALLPECDPVEVLMALAEEGATSGHVLIVGHQPQLGTLAAGLAPATSPALSPAHLVRVTFGGPPGMGAGTLTLRLSPSQLP